MTPCASVLFHISLSCRLRAVRQRVAVRTGALCLVLLFSSLSSLSMRWFVVRVALFHFPSFPFPFFFSFPFFFFFPQPATSLITTHHSPSLFFLFFSSSSSSERLGHARNFGSSLRSRQSSDDDAEGRTRDVIQAALAKEVDAGRIPAEQGASSSNPSSTNQIRSSDLVHQSDSFIRST